MEKRIYVGGIYSAIKFRDGRERSRSGQERGNGGESNAKEERL